MVALFFIGLTWASCVSPSTAEDKVWQVRVLRMEGAAAGVRRSAEDVGDLGMEIANSGRIQRLAELKAKVEVLRRKVVSAQLAAEVLHEGLPKNER